MQNFTIQLPENVKKIIDTIEQNGFEAYAVGGCVRDSVLRRKPDDWDITTSALPEQVKSFFKKTIDTGIQHGTVTVMLGGIGYEVTTYRIDGEYKDGRHPESVAFSAQITDDLKRRDFTINAMAYNDRDGLIDEFGGRADLESKVIRCVGDPKERFTEDALRMMRAIRFSAQLNFSIEPETLDAIGELAPNIEKVSMERIQTELAKTLLSDHPEYVSMYHKTGLFEYCLPLADEILSGKYAKSSLTMLKHSEKTLVLRYAALLNMVKPDEVRETLRSLKLDNNTIATTAKIVQYSREEIDENEPAVRDALHRYGRELMPILLTHQKALLATQEEIIGITFASRSRHLQKIERMYVEALERGDCICIGDLDISGNDLLEYGLKGAEIGKALEELLDVVIENPKLNDKETLIALIEHIN